MDPENRPPQPLDPPELTDEQLSKVAAGSTGTWSGYWTWTGGKWVWTWVWNPGTGSSATS